jgi:hypothetical protein
MTKFQEHVHCMGCGKRVSGFDPELGLVVRAYVECPECIEIGAKKLRFTKAAGEVRGETTHTSDPDAVEIKSGESSSTFTTQIEALIVDWRRTIQVERDGAKENPKRESDLLEQSADTLELAADALAALVEKHRASLEGKASE